MVSYTSGKASTTTPVHLSLLVVIVIESWDKIIYYKYKVDSAMSWDTLSQINIFNQEALFLPVFEPVNTWLLTTKSKPEVRIRLLKKHVERSRGKKNLVRG